jgi:predicted peroxiredoxin
MTDHNIDGNEWDEVIRDVFDTGYEIDIKLAQRFIDTAIEVLHMGSDEIVYLSMEGITIIKQKTKELMAVFTKEEFDDGEMEDDELDWDWLIGTIQDHYDNLTTHDYKNDM